MLHLIKCIDKPNSNLIQYSQKRQQANQKTKKGEKNQMKKENEAKKFIKNAKTVGAVHTSSYKR